MTEQEVKKQELERILKWMESWETDWVHLDNLIALFKRDFDITEQSE